MDRIVRDDISKYFDHNINIPQKTIYIGGEVDHGMAERALKGLQILDAKARKKRLLIIMNNIGGDEYHGLAIYDAIKSCKSPTTIKVYGHAMSMGAWILQAAEKRLLSTNSTVMMHYGDLSYTGHNHDFLRNADETKRLNTLMEDHLLERIKERHPRYTRETLQELIRFDKYLAAKEAVELGLADKVI